MKLGGEGAGRRSPKRGWVEVQRGEGQLTWHGGLWCVRESKKKAKALAKELKLKDKLKAKAAAAKVSHVIQWSREVCMVVVQ